MDSLFENIEMLSQIQSLFDSAMKIFFPKSEWIEGDRLRCYVRCQQNRPIKTFEHGTINVNTLTIANVTVREEYRRQGVYGKFLEDIELLHGIQCIIIENVLEIDQRNIYLKRGYLKLDNGEYDTPSYYKLLPLK